MTTVHVHVRSRSNRRRGCVSVKLKLPRNKSLASPLINQKSVCATPLYKSAGCVFKGIDGVHIQSLSGKQKRRKRLDRESKSKTRSHFCGTVNEY